MPSVEPGQVLSGSTDPDAVKWFRGRETVLETAANKAKHILLTCWAATRLLLRPCLRCAFEALPCSPRSGALPFCRQAKPRVQTDYVWNAFARVFLPRLMIVAAWHGCTVEREYSIPVPARTAGGRAATLRADYAVVGPPASKMCAISGEVKGRDNAAVGNGLPGLAVEAFWEDWGGEVAVGTRVSSKLHEISESRQTWQAGRW